MATYQQESVPRSLAEVGSVTNEGLRTGAESPDKETMQCAEDNPRAASPGTSLADPAPGAPLDPIPQPAQKDPGFMRALVALFLIISVFVWSTVAVTATFTLPGLFTMLIGNAICKAANLPHFTHIKTSVAIGAFGSFFGALCCSVFVVPLGYLGDWMEKRYKERNIRSGRIPPYSSREDGHFPVLLLWVPLVFVACLLSGPTGASVNLTVPGLHDVSKADVTVMSAIGGIIVAPGGILVTLLTYGVLEPIYQFLWDVALETEERGEPEMLPYLWRQGEAFVWLLWPVPRQSSSGSVAICV